MLQSKNNFLGNIPPITKNLLLFNILGWLAQITFIHKFNINYNLGLHYWGAESFYPFQFITYMFLHANITHLFFNMFGLYMFGRILEQYLGPKKFLTYYFITGIGAAIIQQATWSIDLIPLAKQINIELSNGAPIELLAQKNNFFNQFVTIGASGSVFGLLLAFGMLFPEQPLYLMFIPIPIKAKYFVIGYAVIELTSGVANFSFDNIAHFAHLGGMLFGFFLILYWKKQQFKH